MNNPIKQLIFFILTFFVYAVVNAQTLSGEEQAYQNQFEKILDSDRPNATKFQYLLDNLNNLNPRVSTLPIQYAKKGIALARQKNAPKWSGLLSVELGWMYQGLNQITQAENAYKNGISIFDQANLLAEKAKAHGKLSLLYGQTRRSDQALEQAKLSANIAESIGDEVGLAYAYYAMVYNFINSGKDQQALEYIDKSISLYKKHGEKYRVALLMQNKVTSYIHLGKPVKALAAANELVQLFKNTQNNTRDNHYLGQGLFSRAKAYMQLEQYDKALADNDSLQVLLSNKGTAAVDAVYIFQQAKILHYTKKYKASKNICLSLIQHPTVKAERFLGYTYELLAKNCAALKQFRSAYKYHLEFEKYEEKEMVNAAKLRMEEIIAKTELEKNTAIINAQKQALLQQRITQWLAIGLAFILSLLFLQTYRNAKSRKQNNAALRLSNTQLGESNNLLAEKNKENELLLKEIHHRVKNNLEIVSSLLELQAEQLSDATTQEILKDSQNRVQSMGIIHQKLYLGGNLNNVEMRDYFKNLSESILETFNAWDKIDINIDMEKIALDVEIAIPIGLIVNELVTNAWKYAFPVATFKERKGQINLSLIEKSDEHLQLTVSDNGVGKHADAPIQGTGFGSQLINLLTMQLNGKMSESNENGAKFIFLFKR